MDIPASRGRVFMISGCRDHQESADLPSDAMEGNTEAAQGALTGFLLPALRMGLSWGDLVTHLRRKMQESDLPQVRIVLALFSIFSRIFPSISHCVPPAAAVRNVERVRPARNGFLRSVPVGAGGPPCRERRDQAAPAAAAGGRGRDGGGGQESKGDATCGVAAAAGSFEAPGGSSPA
jgi:hypothetical protein